MLFRSIYGLTLIHVDITFNMIFWRSLQVPKYIKVIKKAVLIFIHLDIFTVRVDIHIVTLLSFWLSDEVGLMLTFPFLALLVKVNQVPGGAALTGPMSLCLASVAFTLLFPTMITSFLLWFGSTFGLSLSFAFKHGTSFPLPLSLSTGSFMVARTLSNVGVCFRHSHGAGGPDRMIVNKNLTQLFSDRQYFT